MNAAGFWQLLKQSFNEWYADKAPRLGAALAYYTIFSLAPLLLIAVALASMVFGDKAARGEIVGEIENTMGAPAATAIEEMLKRNYETGGSWPATITGLVLLFFGASGVFIELQDALNTIWKVAPRPGRGWLNMIRDRFVSFTVVLGTGFLLLVSLAVSAGLAALNRFLTPESVPGGTHLWQGLNALVSFGLITLLFAMIYKILPDVTVAWRDVWTGAAFTALLFTVGKHLIGLYLGQSSTASVFGAAGSLAIILVWVYYSSQILLFGAEFTRVYALRRGSHVVPTREAMPVTEEMRARQGMGSREEIAARAGASTGQ
jgi:membrane protein